MASTIIQLLLIQNFSVGKMLPVLKANNILSKNENTSKSLYQNMRLCKSNVNRKLYFILTQIFNLNNLNHCYTLR